MTDTTSPHDMAELFAAGTETVTEQNTAAQAAGLVGLLSVLTSAVAVVAAAVVTVGFFGVVFGGVMFAFGAGLSSP